MNLNRIKQLAIAFYTERKGHCCFLLGLLVATAMLGTSGAHEIKKWRDAAIRNAKAAAMFKESAEYAIRAATDAYKESGEAKAALSGSEASNDRYEKKWLWYKFKAEESERKAEHYEHKYNDLVDQIFPYPWYFLYLGSGENLISRETNITKNGTFISTYTITPVPPVPYVLNP